MSRERLQHDAAWAAAQALLDTVAHLLREEEQRDAFHEFYTRVKAALECYEMMAQREAVRLKPSRN